MIFSQFYLGLSDQVVALSNRFGYLSANNLELYYQTSALSAYVLTFDMTFSRVYTPLGVCFVKANYDPNVTILSLSPINLCQIRPGYHVVPYLEYDIHESLVDPTSTNKMCLGADQYGNTILSAQACGTGAFDLLPAN